MRGHWRLWGMKLLRFELWVRGLWKSELVVVGRRLEVVVREVEEVLVERQPQVVVPALVEVVEVLEERQLQVVELLLVEVEVEVLWLLKWLM